MRRLGESDKDKGATAVVFAICLVMLVGFVGLGVDVTASYAKDQEMQHAADAAALAVAHECATQEDESCDLASKKSLAESYAAGNVIDSTKTVEANLEAGVPANSVQVTTSTTRDNWFLPLFGINETEVGADATAVWGAPTGGPAYLPIIFSICDFEYMSETGASRIIELPKKNDAPCDWGQDGNVMPGGFGFIGNGSCEVDISVDGWIESYQGAAIPCSSGELAAMVDKTILLPVFDKCRRANPNGSDNNSHCPQSSESSNHGDYHVWSFAAFVLEGYRFNGSWTDKNLCASNSNCIQGVFVEYVTLDEAFDYGSAPDAGAYVVALVD